MKVKRSENRPTDIVFINQDSGYLMIDLINTYVEAGHRCTLIAGRLIERGNPLDSSVKVRKIIKYNRDTLVKRFFTWIWATFQIVFLIRIKHHHSNLFIVSNPPLAPLISLLFKNTYSILIFDIYPDALVDSGFLSEGNIIIKLWKKANAVVFNKAHRVFTITKSMGEVLKQYSGDKTVELVPIWSDNSYLKYVNPLDNPFIKKYNLSGKFIVMYSGNIGLSGQIDVLLEIAKEFARTDIAFLFIGEGAKKKWLEDKVIEYGLENVLIIPWQPAKDLAYSLSCADLAVVGIDQKVSRLAMPSKLLSYLSVGAPILCLAGANTDLAKFVEENMIGKAFDSSQKREVLEYIEWLASDHDKCLEIRNNSLAVAEKFTISNARLFL